MKIAIIGAGIAGLSAARELSRTGEEVTVFDKGRAPGGRVSTRLQSGYEFDHGAPFFAASDSRFRGWIDQAVQAGFAAKWPVNMVEVVRGRVVGASRKPEQFVGIPRMNALSHFLAQGIVVHSSTRVTAAARSRGQWDLVSTAKGDLGRFDALLVSTPPAQALPFLTEAPALRDRVERVSMKPCWTVMAAFDSSVPVAWDVANVANGALEKVTRNAAKPGRREAETWVMHARAGWTAQNIDAAPEDVVEELLEDFASAVDSPLPSVRFATAHRWRYARPAAPLSSAYLWDDVTRLGVCGDWCNGDDIESAFVSGLDLALAVSRSGS